MGRRIYENGKFVWKYTFGRQTSEMIRLAEEFGVGNYSTNISNDEDEQMTCRTWSVNKETDLPKLKKVLEDLLQGKTIEELQEIGIKSLKDFVEKQSPEWKKNFEKDLEWVNSAKSDDDFQYYGSFSNNMKFNTYDIYANAIEEQTTESWDFIKMVKTFIEYIEKEDRKEFAFDDEY